MVLGATLIEGIGMGPPRHYCQASAKRGAETLGHDRPAGYG